MNKRKMLIEALQNEVISDDKANMLYDLVSMNDCISKHELPKLAGCDVEHMNYDTAYPIDYYRALRDHYPDATNGLYIFDYTEDKVFGRMVNINNLFTKHILKTFQS